MKIWFLVADAARAHASCHGARLTGAGFGGCAVVACRPDAATAVAQELERRFAERFGHPPVCFAVTAAGAASAVNLTVAR